MVLADDLDWPSSIVADAGSLYWIDSSNTIDAKIVRMSKSGGPRVTLADHASHLTLQDGWIYYGYSHGHTDQLRRVSVNGGPPQAIADADVGDHLVVTGGSVCWEARPVSEILCAPVSGGSPTIRKLPFFYDFALAGTRVYFANHDGVFVSEGDAAPRRIASGSANQLQRDETHLYWSSGGNVWRVPHAGGPPQRVAHTEGGPFTLHANSVYWMNGFGLYRAPKGGGPAERRGRLRPPIRGLETPDDLIVDGANVYWLSHGTYTPDPPDALPCPKPDDPNTGVIARMRM
jgi:hypothetical protein